MTATRRHRPAYVLWLGPGRLPVSCCDCHLGQPVALDRPLPVHGETMRRAA